MLDSAVWTNMYYDTEELEQAQQACYTENNFSPNRVGIHLRRGMSGGAMYCLIATRVKAIKSEVFG